MGDSFEIIGTIVDGSFQVIEKLEGIILGGNEGVVEGIEDLGGEVGEVADPVRNFVGGGVVDVDAVRGREMVRDDGDEGEGVGGGVLELEVGGWKGVVDSVDSGHSMGVLERVMGGRHVSEIEVPIRVSPMHRNLIARITNTSAHIVQPISGVECEIKVTTNDDSAAPVDGGKQDCYNSAGFCIVIAR